MGVETRICPLYLCVGIWPVEAIVVDFINEQTNKQWNNSERETGREGGDTQNEGSKIREKPKHVW